MKVIAKKIFIGIGGDYMLRLTNRSPRILFWHGVDNITNPIVEAESFEIATFKRQIDYLQKYYEIISIDEFYCRYMNNTFTKKEIVLTFDDGYANNFHTVGQIMKEYNLPYTVFISTEHIETGELFPTSIARLIVLGSELKKISIPSLRNKKYDISTQELKMVTYSIISGELKIKPLNQVRQIVQDLKNNVSNAQYKALVDMYKSVKPMTWNMVIKLHKMGATIGSHCMYHICCHENQDISEVRKQISESKIIIENKLQSKCDFFAYPNGDYTDDSNKLVLDAGYKMGFSTNSALRIGHFHHVASVPRIGVQRRLDTFKIHIGLYPSKVTHM